MSSYSELSEHELRTRLRGIATEHQPDRTAMLNRVARDRVGSPVVERRPAGQALRLAGSALAVATVLGVGGFARWALADGTEPGVVPVLPPAATSPASAPARTAPPSTAPTTSASATAASDTAAAKTPAARTPPADARAQDDRPTTGSPAAGPPQPANKTTPEATRQIAPGDTWADREVLRSDGSVAPDDDGTDGRSHITLEVREPVIALEVSVRVARTPGLTDRGATHDVTGAGIGTEILHEPDALVYHFELADGATLRAGTYVFVAKYAVADEGGRDAGADTYRVTATAARDSAPVHLNGDFF